MEKVFKIVDNWKDSLIIEPYTTKNGEKRVYVFLEVYDKEIDEYLSDNDVAVDFSAEEFYNAMSNIKEDKE